MPSFDFTFTQETSWVVRIYAATQDNARSEAKRIAELCKTEWRQSNADYIHNESNMTTTEMHDLLALALNDIRKRPIYEAGTMKGFTHIMYCRFCSYSQSHVADHGHGEDCLYGRLERACSGGSARG